VTTERILSKEQTAEVGYLRRVNGVTLRGKKHRSEIYLRLLLIYLKLLLSEIAVDLSEIAVI